MNRVINLNENMLTRIVRESVGKILSESPERVVTDDPFVEFAKTLKDGQIVMFGYLNYAYIGKEELRKLFPSLDDETIGKRVDQLTIKPTRKRMDPELGARFRGYRDEHVAGNQDSELDTFLSSTLSDIDAYNADTRKTKRKTMDFPFSDRYSIVEFMVLSVTWRSARGLAKFYKGANDDYLRLRKEYGFGEEGAENTWRGKSTVYKTGKHAGETKYTYGGAGLLPVVNPDAPDNVYKKVHYGDDFADTYEDERTGMRSYRQQSTVYGTPRYFLVNMDTGKTEELSKKFVDFLRRGMSARTVSSVEDLEDDEKAYKEALAKIREREASVWNLMKDKTLYIHATRHGENGEKTAIDWNNSELESRFPGIVSIIKSAGNRTGTLESCVRNAVMENPVRTRKSNKHMCMSQQMNENKARKRENTVKLNDGYLRRVIMESVRKVLCEGVDATGKVQALVDAANAAYRESVEACGDSMALMGKNGSSYGLIGPVVLRRGRVVINYDDVYDNHMDIDAKVLVKRNGRVALFNGDFYDEGWKDVKRHLETIINDAERQRKHNLYYNPNNEDADSPEDFEAKRKSMRDVNKLIGLRANTGVSDIRKNY